MLLHRAKLHEAVAKLDPLKLGVISNYSLVSDSKAWSLGTTHVQLIA